MLELRRLRLLSELRVRGTVTAVAEALAYSPSTVSQQLAELQREAGAVLFERDGRRLRLTAAGFVLADHADALLARMEQAEAEVAATVGAVAGVVRIAAFQTAMSLVAPALAELAVRHPALRVETRVTEPDEALALVERRGCDLAVFDEFTTAPRPRTSGLHVEELRLDRIHAVLPRTHPAAARPAVPITALAADVWAAGPPETSHGRLVDEVCRDQGGFPPDIRHRTSDALALLFLVAAGQAVTLLPELARPERDPAVAVVPIDGAPVIRRILTAVRESALHSPALAAVRAALRPGG
ncbi:LysR family transcriptional regulator [Yinghuangia seranimata]|uniref:LysR family transcriptional regulator n=1 Tax=Yinghuangia seranimata TaxID=408067 RepID=UPI00248CB31B|nr:LysR family transcriptional regulator [Yinghuangia seranimata]MDI2129920.1 LysR family transcriptional regulator [Yinghuangia seranimata]